MANGVLSEYIYDKIESFMDVNVLSDQEKFSGRFFLEDFEVLPSAGPFLYNQASSRNMCKGQCLHLSSLSSMECLLCKEGELKVEGKCS